jgi:hypothetical protein
MIVFVSTPGKPDSFGDEIRRCIEELPPCASSRENHSTVKMKECPMRKKLPRRGQP